MFEVLPSLKFLYKCHCTLHLNLASEMDPHFTLYLNCFLLVLQTKAIRRFVITEKAPIRAFSWLKGATTAFIFKTLLRHYAKRAFDRDYKPSDGAF